jgi:hypothetical protein
MTMDARQVADQMMTLIGQAPMSDRVRARFQALAVQANPTGILNQLEAYIRERPDVGKSVIQGGQVAFELVHRQVKELHDSWIATSR